MNDAIKVGDCVYLKSGGFVMAVATEPAGTPLCAGLVWHDDVGRINTAIVPVDCLDLVRDKPNLRPVPMQ